MKVMSRPRNLFLTILLSFFVLIIIIDRLYGRSYASFSSTFFLCQSIAIVITTLTVVAKPRWRSASLPWLVAMTATFVVMLHSFTTFHYGPRITTEGDGPATVGYICEYGESYTTVKNLTGIQKESFTANNLNANLCWLKEMPLAASNVTPYFHTDYDNYGFGMFLIYESVVGGSFFITKKLNKTYKHARLNSKRKH